MRKKRNDFDAVGVERMTDAELSKKLGGYQRTESISISLGVILVITACISMFIQYDPMLVCALAFPGVVLFLLVAKPAQTKKKALMQQQLGDFFRTELSKAFGPEPEPATLPIDWAYLKATKLSVVDFTECTVTDFHEGEHKGLRFSAANVELRRTVEERSGSADDDWMSRTETLFRGIVVRCKDICAPTLDIVLNDMFQERKKDDITDPAAFQKHFAAHTADGREADNQVTPQLRDLVQKLEASSRTSKLCGLILRDGDLTLALNTRYVFAGVPEWLDLRDIDGIRKWFTASLTSMGNLLDLITESPALTVGWNKEKNMAEQKTNMTDEQLAQELRKSKGGKLGGKILSLLGGVIAVAGMILGGNLVLVVIGGVVLGLGQMVQGKSKEQAGRQTFDSIAPDIVGTAFENVQMNPVPPLLDASDTNIPLPSHTHCSGSGYIRGTYRGLTTELCTVRLTEVSEFQREETGLWEKNEQEVYTGQWMLCQLNREFPTWLTIWPRDRLDKLFSSKTIQTGNEGFDKRFNLSSDDEAAALCILSPGRMERILALADSSIGKFAVNLNSDGRLYIAVHSGHGFFDIGKGHENPTQLRQRFARERKWFTDMIGAFRDV